MVLGAPLPSPRRRSTAVSVAPPLQERLREITRHRPPHAVIELHVDFKVAVGRLKYSIGRGRDLWINTIDTIWNNLCHEADWKAFTITLVLHNLSESKLLQTGYGNDFTC